jgi:uncharacterized protein (DUF952 family)
MKYLYHIAKVSDWEQAQQNGSYAIGSLQRSFEEDGFIHLAYGRQVNIIADMIYKETPDLVLLKINPDRLTAEVKDEVADVPRDTFPHLYGSLNIDAVESVDPYDISSNGCFPKIED